MRSHRHYLWNNGFVGPLNAENFCKFLKVVCRRFTDGENSVAQPPHAESRELFVEELDT